MKLVASAKLRKAQQAIVGMRPYEEMLLGILSSVATSAQAHRAEVDVEAAQAESPVAEDVMNEEGSKPVGKVAIVAVSGNTSLCGGFNANIIRKALDTVKQYPRVEVYSIGRKMADAMRRAGHPSPADYSDLIARPVYDKSCELATLLSDKFEAGEFSKVLLVYSRFISTSSQEPTVEQFLPFDFAEMDKGQTLDEDYIIEPSKTELASSLLPKALMLKFFAALLDSAAAEQAARTIAMQAATDNAEELLDDLTLEYNKSRQQKITSELLDLEGGSAQ